MKKTMLIFIAALLLMSCTKTNEKKDKTIYTTLYVYQDITKSLIKDYANVVSIYSSNSDAHDFELSTKETKKIIEADLFIASSESTEHFLHELEDLKLKNLLVIAENEKFHELNTDLFTTKLDTKEHSHQLEDGHFYLSPKRLPSIIEVISDALVEKYPEEQKNIENNKKDLLRKVEEVNKEYEEFTTENYLLTGHQSFDYLNKDYGINVEHVYGLSHEEEPSTKEIKGIIEKLQKNDIKVIFADMNESSNLVDQIVKEADVTKVEVNNLETPVENKDFITILKENLEKFKKVN